MNTVGEIGLTKIGKALDDNLNHNQGISNLGNNIETAIVFAASAVCVGHIVGSFLKSLSLLHLEKSRQSHNLVLKKIDKQKEVEKDLDSYNMEVSNCANSQWLFLAGYTVLGFGTVSCFIFLTTISYRKLK